MNIRNFLEKTFEKWPAKVISLAAALIISVFYRFNNLDSRIIFIPLITENSLELIATDYISNSVRVTLRGEAQDIISITEDDILAFIDLKKYTKPGTYRVPVQIRKTNNAVGIDPLEISVSPMEIHITLEEKVSKYIPVYPVFSGTVAQGYEITRQSITPESVVAEGPRSIIENLKEFRTEKIDLDGRNTGFSVLAGIVNENPNITILGNRFAEFNCRINYIERTAPLIFFVPYEEEDENNLILDEDNIILEQEKKEIVE